MSEFTNEPIDLAGVPTLEDDRFVAVHPNHLRVALLGRAAVAALAVVAGVMVAILVPERSWIPLLVAAGIVAFTLLDMWLTTIEVRHLAYQVREQDVSYRSGVLVKRVATVPFVRVQHARIRQGPVQRRFGLATVEVNSAGPDLMIKGLGADQAERLKGLVVERAGDLDEEP